MTTPTPEAIEAAAVAMFYGQNGIRSPWPLWEGAGPDENDSYRDLAKLALTAALPLIAAQAKAEALREAARDAEYELDLVDEPKENAPSSWLRARAETIEGKSA